ncbi:MAG: helix-turn-helix domain-containing protein [Treponemataceae bacterium]|nr:helix-turn-helix domain-containing protein [Treponemataceae bacterium]
MGFRENLKGELTYQDITVKELAEQTGISKHTIDHYLTKNGSRPQVELAVKIARALNVSVEYLVYGNNPTKTENFRNINDLADKLSKLSDNDFEFAKRLIELLYYKKNGDKNSMHSR